MNNVPVIYTTTHGTEYVVAPSGNLHGGERVKRMVYISPDEVRKILNRGEKGISKPLDREQMFQLKSSDSEGGRVLYEEVDGKLKLSGEVIGRHPVFGRNGQGRNVGDIAN